MSPFLLCPSDTGGEQVSVQRSANSHQQDKEKIRLFNWFDKLNQLGWLRTKKDTHTLDSDITLERSLWGLKSFGCRGNLLL